MPVSNALDELRIFAHRSYVRMEAEQLIDDCLLQEDLTPFEALIEGLVLGGASSLVLLREVLEQILETKSSLSEEGLGVRQDLMDALSEFGVYLPQLLSADAPESFRSICYEGLGHQASASVNHLEFEDEALLHEICIEAGDRVRMIAHRLSLLNHLERSTRDWIVSLAYEAIREGGEGASSDTLIH